MKSLKKLFLVLKEKLKPFSLKHCSLKQRFVWGALLLITAGLIYLAVALLTVNPAEISLLKLKKSIAEETICHEVCLNRRAQEAAIVIKALFAGDQKLTAAMVSYFSDPQESRNFKKELVKIWRQVSADYDTPDFLEEYLRAPDGDPELQALIIKLFLAAETDNPRIDYYFSLLEGEAPLVLKQEAVRALSDLENKENYFSAAQLVIIKKIVLDPATDKKLRAVLVLLLSDYYPLFKSASEDILQTVYEKNSLNDNISRAFAADNLNQVLGRVKFPLPEISASEWTDYYNN
ncbi:MAG: hypothetical protein WC523_06600 [Patescibacteria group bacterium]|jgi:hypothetical protein